MKKLFIALLASLLVLTTGCAADGKANIKNRDEVVLSINGKDYTKGQFYDALVTSNAEGIIINKLIDMIYAKHVSEDDSEVKKEVADMIEEVKEMYGDYAETMLSYMGYADFDDYEKGMLISFKVEEIARLYIEEKESELIEKTMPRKAKIMDVSDVEKANEVINRIEAGESMSDLASEYESSEYNGEETVYFDGYSALEECITLTLGNATNGLLKEPVSSDDSKYYVIEYTDCDPNNFKDELADAWLNSTAIDSIEILGYYAKQGGFKIYDEDIYYQFVKDYPELVD